MSHLSPGQDFAVSRRPEGQSGEGARAPRPVYVVDDDSMVRRALFFALHESGYSPRSFVSGIDFLQERDHLPPGCVLLDLRMAKLDGFGVLDQLAPTIERFPVVVITGHGDVQSAVDAMKRGASDFLEKPISSELLFEVLEDLFHKLSLRTSEASKREKAKERVSKLTVRETEIVQGVVAGLTNKLIAFRFGISVRTVEVHRANIAARIGTKSVAELVELALSAELPKLNPHSPAKPE